MVVVVDVVDRDCLWLLIDCVCSRASCVDQVFSEVSEVFLIWGLSLRVVFVGWFVDCQLGCMWCLLSVAQPNECDRIVGVCVCGKMKRSSN